MRIAAAVLQHWHGVVIVEIAVVCLQSALEASQSGNDIFRRLALCFYIQLAILETKFCAILIGSSGKRSHVLQLAERHLVQPSKLPVRNP